MIVVLEKLRFLYVFRPHGNEKLAFLNFLGLKISLVTIDHLDSCHGLSRVVTCPSDVIHDHHGTFDRHGLYRSPCRLLQYVFLSKT